MVAKPDFVDLKGLGYRIDPPRVELALKEGLKAKKEIVFGENPSALLLVDFLNDFVLTSGKLSVSGGIEALKNTINILYDKAHIWEKIFILRDFHTPGIGITNSSWWTNKDTGLPPDPFTQITLKDFYDKKGNKKGCWEPLFEPEWSRHYIKELAKTGQPPLTIWYPHCEQETPGANMPSELVEAITFLQAAVGTKIFTLTKGMNPLTDQFGFFPCVPVPGDPHNFECRAFLSLILRQRIERLKVYIAGLAEDICVHQTISQVISVATKIGFYPDNFQLLEDCISPVEQKDHGKYFPDYKKVWINIFSSTSI
jgi:nicotinamidase-related amidase